MSDAGELRRRVVEQFSYVGDRAAAWRAFDRLLPTGSYLNLGYSPRYWPTVLGDSQARLAALVGDGLAGRVGDPDGTRLLDVGCGRGGPARQFAARGFDVVGVDLVRYNVHRARERRDDVGDGPAFLVGDATALPFPDGAVGAAAAVDSLVYLPERRAALEAAALAIEPDGWFAVADLLARPGAAEDPALAAFADAWDTAPPVDADAHHGHLRDAGFAVEATRDLTPNSTGRFRKWSRAFLALADGPAGGALRRLLGRWGVPPDPAIAQVRAAHRALPHLAHELVYARRRA